MKKTIEELKEEVEQCRALKKDINVVLDEMIKNAEEDLEKIKQESTEWIPDEGSYYWAVDTDIMDTRKYRWDDDNNDNTRLRHKVVFKTEQEAEEWLEYLTAKEKTINEFSQEKWENSNINKYYIRYDHEDKEMGIENNQFLESFNALYFNTKGEAQSFIDKYKKQIKRDMGICEN